MLNKSRYQYLTGQRQYDIPGASLRGPYKRWIPQTDNRHSESETDAPKAPTSSSHRTQAQYGSSSHAAVGSTAYATTSSSNSRNHHMSSSHHAVPAPSPAPQKQRAERTERTPYGYSSESTVHAPVHTSKPSSSSFGLFKSHPKDSRGHSTSNTVKREELPRSTTAPAAVPSRHLASHPVPVPTSAKPSSRNVPAHPSGPSFGTPSTQSSTDPSPRSSTDSGPRSGHVSAPVAGYSDARKQSHAIWNPYVDARLNAPSTSRKNESVPPSRRDDRKTKDKEDMVARVTEALGGGSTGKAKAAESVLLQGQSQAVKGDDASSTRRTTASTGTRLSEATSHAQTQATPTLRRYKTTPQATPLMANGHLPDNNSKSSRPSTTSSRGYPEMSTSRIQSPPEPPAKVPPSSSSKVPHSRTTSSPWPFNQALPPEQIVPVSKPQSSQTHSSSWKPFARFGSSTSKSPDSRVPSTDNPSYSLSSSHATSMDTGRGSEMPHTAIAANNQQQPRVSSGKSSLPRSTAASSNLATTSTASRIAPTSTTGAAPPLQNEAQTRTQARLNSSYATTSTSTELPQRWSPNAHGSGRSPSAPTITQHSQSASQGPGPTTSRYTDTIRPSTVEPAPSPANGGRYAVYDTQSPISNVPARTTSERADTLSTALQSQNASQSPWPTTSRHPETINVSAPTADPPSAPTGRYATSGTHSASVDNSTQGAPGKSAATSTGPGIQQNSTQSLWPTTSRHPETGSAVSLNPQPPNGGRYPNGAPSAIINTPSEAVPSRSVTLPSGTPQPQATSQSLWSTSSRYPETAATAATEPTQANVGRYTTGSTQLTVPAGAWASKSSSTNLPSTNYEGFNPLKESVDVLAVQTTHSATNGHAGTPPKQEIPGRSMTNGTSTPEKSLEKQATAGAWTSKYATANTSASTFEVFSTPKPSPRVPVTDSSAAAISKYMPTTSLGPESASRMRLEAVTSTPSNPPVTTAPGAWTTSSRYATNTSGSIFDNSLSVKSQGINPSPREASTRQATLGTTPVAGAWTTKQSPINATPASSESTLKQSPTNNTPSPSSLKPQPASGTTTGTSTPSSAQMSDIIAQLSPVTSHSIATRVPISGHPSTPAPVRPVLHPTLPPLSISSTSPDTDSLLTPSSLNSPRSTLMLPQSQPVATVTVSSVARPSEKETAPRKNGFFDFFRPKPPLKYEVWTPPTQSSKEKERKRAEPPRIPAPSPPKPKPSASVPIPSRPRSPKIGRNPFKLFARRHRTVSTASLDVLDGTPTNTLMNSPASSMRADTPGAPPSPPLRDAILATQEWRNNEAKDLVVSGRKRRPRPGVTFDCPEDVAPIDILPSRLRVPRLLEDDDDY